MKKSILILSIFWFGTGCGNNSDKTAKPASNNASTSASTSATDPAIQKGLDLVAKNDCFTCHKIAEPSVGPAYQKVAQKYQPTQDVIDTLAQKIIRGGSGNWGTVPMTPHQTLSAEDAQTMVKYVLSLK